MSAGRILVVDDHAPNLKLARIVLEMAGFEVRTAGDAARMRAEVASFAPELILMDVQMPDADGLTLARELKSGPATAGIRIVAMTANVTRADEESARAAGCDGYLTKPMDVKRLPGQVRAWLGREG